MLPCALERAAIATQLPESFQPSHASIFYLAEPTPYLHVVLLVLRKPLLGLPGKLLRPTVAHFRAGKSRLEGIAALEHRLALLEPVESCHDAAALAYARAVRDAQPEVADAVVAGSEGRGPRLVRPQQPMLARNRDPRVEARGSTEPDPPASDPNGGEGGVVPRGMLGWPSQRSEPS